LSRLYITASYLEHSVPYSKIRWADCTLQQVTLSSVYLTQDTCHFPTDPAYTQLHSLTPNALSSMMGR